MQSKGFGGDDRLVYPNETMMIFGKEREIIRRGEQQGFPYIASVVNPVPYAEHSLQWHLHDYFEFGVVESGRVILGLPIKNFVLNEGDGYFINSNVMHYRRAAENESGARIHTQVFERSLISGIDMIGSRYVAPLESCIAMEGFMLYASNPEHAVILQNLRDAFQAAERDENGCELHICANLNLAWANLYYLAEPYFDEKNPKGRERALRARFVLAYMNQNYDKALTIKEIADAAGISERECYRYFTKYLNTTPTEYLNRYRIAVAARMLAESDLPISQVAQQCGFSDASYFSMVFRKVMEKTPREYRRMAEAGREKDQNIPR